MSRRGGRRLLQHLRSQSILVSEIRPRDEVDPINRRGAELARQAVGKIEPASATSGRPAPSAGAGRNRRDPRRLRRRCVDPGNLSRGTAHSPFKRYDQLFPGRFRWQSVSANGPVDKDAAIVARQLLDAGVTVLGINCRPGLADAIEFARRMSSIVDCPLLVKQVPAFPRNRTEAASFAAAVPALLALNVQRLGGCCGTTELRWPSWRRLVPAHPSVSDSPIKGNSA